MIKLNAVIDESGLNARWLPDNAADSRLTLLHYVRNLHKHAKQCTFHRLGERKVPRPAELPYRGHLVLGGYFDDDWRLLTIALQQDIEWLRNRLPKLVERLGLPEGYGKIELPDPDGEALQGFSPDKQGWGPFEEETRKCLTIALSEIEMCLARVALQTELPLGWERDVSGGLPFAPVRNVAELKVHLSEMLTRIQRDGMYPATLIEVTRELRNTRRALRKFFDNDKVRPAVNDVPTDVFEAERELERLVDLLNLAPGEQYLETEPNESAIRGAVIKSKEIQTTITESTLPRRSPGKPRTIDPMEQLIVLEWKSKKYKTIKELVEGMALKKIGNTTPARRARLAVERDRKRCQRAKEQTRTKPTVK